MSLVVWYLAKHFYGLIEWLQEEFLCRFDRSINGENLQFICKRKFISFSRICYVLKEQVFYHKYHSLSDHKFALEKRKENFLCLRYRDRIQNNCSRRVNKTNANCHFLWEPLILERQTNFRLHSKREIPIKQPATSIIKRFIFHFRRKWTNSLL